MSGTESGSGCLSQTNLLKMNLPEKDFQWYLSLSLSLSHSRLLLSTKTVLIKRPRDSFSSLPPPFVVLSSQYSVKALWRWRWLDYEIRRPSLDHPYSVFKNLLTWSSLSKFHISTDRPVDWWVADRRSNNMQSTIPSHTEKAHLV